MRRAILSWTIVLGGLLSLGMLPVSAQEDSGKASIDVSYITDDFFAAVVLRPDRIAASRIFKDPPFNQALPALKKVLTIDPARIEQVILLMEIPDLGLHREEERQRRQRETLKLIKELGKEFDGETLKLIKELGKEFKKFDGKSDEGEFEEERAFKEPQRRDAPKDLNRKPRRREPDSPFAIIVRLRDPIAGEDLLVRLAKATGFPIPKTARLKIERHKGKKIYRMDGSPLAAYIPNKRTVVLASGAKLRRMITTPAGKSSLARKLKGFGAHNDLLAVVNARALRKPIAELQRNAWGVDEKIVIAVANQIVRRLEYYSLTADITEGIRLRYELDAKDEKAAELLHDLVRGSFALGRILLPAIAEQISDEGPIANDVVKNITQIMNAVFPSIKTKRIDDRVVIELDLTKQYPKLLAATAAAVAAAREQARLAQAINNLFQLGIAIHNFHDTYNRLPAQGSYDEKGKPLLSWRVHILPFLEDGQLYERFHLDEPWDSPHNKKLIAEMPDVFSSHAKKLPDGKTCFVFPVSNDKTYGSMVPPGAPFKGKANKRGQGRTSIAFITDGTSNTMMIIEAAPENAVVWTKPDDWTFDVKNPKKGLFGMRRGFALAIGGDASRAQRLSGRQRVGKCRKLPQFNARMAGKANAGDSIHLRPRRPHRPRDFPSTLDQRP